MQTLVFSFDGTGNEPSQVNEFKQDESITNVLKLHIMMGGCMEAGKNGMQTPSRHDQKTYYYNGIGTRDGRYSIPLVGRLRSWINMALAPTFGDARRILNEAREDFRNSAYKKGDRVVVFGFSRGAALARKFISELLADNPQYEVSFLGVYDTVAAMNGVYRRGDPISSDVLFEDGTLHASVKHAVHLLALDEERVAFTPTLVNRDPNPNSTRILEVWMPGIHSDIGGGYWMDGLADLSLSFMINKCEQALGPHITIHTHTAQITALLKAQTPRLADITVDDVVIRKLPHGVLHENSGLDATLGGREPRAVYITENDRPVKTHDPRDPRDPRDLPLVHSAILDRFETVAGYRPPALRGVGFRLFFEDNRPPIVMEGIAGLREELSKRQNGRADKAVSDGDQLLGASAPTARAQAPRSSSPRKTAADVTPKAKPQRTKTAAKK